MEWQDEGVLLSVRKHGESSAIANILTREHGRHAGLVRGGTGKRMRGILQPGNRVSATWRGRLPEHLGTFSIELNKSHAALAMSDAGRLAAMTSACALVEAALPEREPHPALLEGLQILLDALSDDDIWPVIYVKWEIGLLQELGFGLDFSACAATGTTKDLTFVSPKSGRAVSSAAAAPYKEKLLRLPRFLLDATTAREQDIAVALKLTQYFLEKHVFHHRDAAIPAARQRLADRYRTNA